MTAVTTSRYIVTEWVVKLPADYGDVSDAIHMATQHLDDANVPLHDDSIQFEHRDGALVVSVKEAT